MSIPKKIHYVWVGGKEKPKKVKKCIDTWKKHFKDYEIIEWNENNFDIESSEYTKSAYEAEKWSFVSDYIRMYALYKEGGIYLDTDVIALDNLDELLNNRAFLGFENEKYISCAVIGAEKEHPLIAKILNYYDSLENKTFNFNDNNSILVTDILEKNYNCKLDNTEQILADDIKIYKDTVLSNPSSKSKLIHVFSGSWVDGKINIKMKLCQEIKYHLTTKKRAEMYKKALNK